MKKPRQASDIFRHRNSLNISDAKLKKESTLTSIAEPVLSKYLKLLTRKSPPILSYSVVCMYIAATLLFIWMTISTSLDWASQRNDLMTRNNLNIYDVDLIEAKLQIISLSATSAAVFLTLTAKLFIRIRGDGKNFAISFISTIMLASPAALFFLPQPWSLLLPAILVALTILLDDSIAKKQMLDQG